MVQIIQPSYTIEEYPRNALVRIERHARRCYKSEGFIREGSAEKLVRSLIRQGHLAMIEMGGIIDVTFVSDRGFSHEMVRHRMASYAQESTRYCNYTRTKFGGEILCIDPSTILKDNKYDRALISKVVSSQITTWVECEKAYFGQIRAGVSPQIARNSLPLGLKTEIGVVANLREWRHILEQRISRRAHPRMGELMRPLLKELKQKIAVVFDDIDVAVGVE